MIKNFGIVFTVFAAALLVFGCSEREDNIVRPDSEVRDGLTGVYIFPGGHLAADELAFSMFNSVRKVPSIYLKVYAPPDYEPTGRRYPVLYMMSPFRGDDSYYFNHGLVAIADQMIADGEIQPMIIVCIDGSVGYGGTFYGNTYFGGKYAQAIGSIQNDPISGSIIDYIDGVFNTYDSRADRAIAGFGMGGYGAVRIAAMYPDNFGAVSAISAPLDFDGAAGTGGFVPLFKDVISNLSGTGSDYISLAEYRDMDTAYSNPLRTMMMAAGTAFTPHVLDIDNIISLNPPRALDSTFIEDTLTYLNPEGNVAFHLPFDTAGNPYQPIWDLWLDNNVSSIIENNPGCFDNMAVKLFTTNDDEYGFNVQTINFASWLQGYMNMRGYVRDYSPDNYEGYEGYEATGGRMLYDILPVLLKYHSDNFPNYDEE